MQVAQVKGIAITREVDGRPQLVALFVFFAYYLGAKLGFALTFQPYPISAMWPPNSILLAALLLTPTRMWWLPIAAALPAHLLSELQGGVPSSMIAAWFVSNCSEALIGAAGIRFLAREGFDFRTLRNVAIFVGCGVFLGPFVSSFVDAAFVSAIGWGGQKDYWVLWRSRFCANALAALMFVPVIVTWWRFRFESIKRASFATHLEAALLSLGLLLVAIVLFNGDGFAAANPALAFAPVPFFIWAALRFGPAGASLSVLAIALAAISGAAHGHGPFVSSSPMETANAIQIFLTLVAIPLLVLSASLAEREASNRALAATEEELRMALVHVKRAAGVARREAALLESESRFRELADSLPHVIWAASADGHVDYFNRRWYELTDEKIQAGESGWFPLMHTEDRASGRAAWNESIRSVLPFDLEFRLLCATPRGYRWQKVRALPVLDENGQVVRWNGTLTDIHESKVAEHTLREIGEQANQALRQEIADHKKTEGALTHLTRVAILGELTSALAHELNQPLTAILANAQATQRVLARESFDLDEVREILGDIVFEDKRASDVIHHLRSLLKKGEPHFQPVAIDEIVRRALNISRSELEARGVAFEHRALGVLPVMMGDKVQLEQVFLNLILNACEAMDGEASVRRAMSLETRVDADAMIHASVRDTGPGIPPHLLGGLFAPFYTTKETGLGLGLSISRSIVDAHGGRIWAENALEGGCVIHLTLPPLVESAA